ncbi:anti-sigma factor [Sphingomicrobium marinum]|uniref:anti-sigma factor n=1 Tax=Sphingomicrobium marinum TaxID=1227950 RepID=UPI00223ED534|nr:anti-sigma factor [Sphingomicrobium marinum]
MTDDPQKDPVVTAAELALGLLEGSELADANRRLLADADFAELVDWWHLKFAHLSRQFDAVPPPSSIWPAIDSHLAGQDDIPAIAVPTGKGWRKRAAGFLGFMLGVAVMLYVDKGTDLLGPRVVEVPVEQPVSVTPQLFAALDGGETGPDISTRLDPASRKLAVQIAGVPEAELGPSRAPELWVVPAGGAPQSLGLLPYQGGYSRELGEAEAALFAAGATIAVTYEERDSAPHSAPTTDIVAAGQLIEI